MLHPLGKQARTEGDLVDALLECHERIRRFTALAVSVAARTDLPAAEVVDACVRIDRYFREALPLHVRDEEDSLLPRLFGLRPDLDAALAAMRAEHASHDAPLAALSSALAAVRARPDDGAARAVLGQAAAALDHAFAPHLDAEETIVFPALRAHLADDVRAAVRAELIERRTPTGR